MRSAAGAQRPRRRGPPALPFRARQGARGRGRACRRRSQHYAEGNRAAAGDARTTTRTRRPRSCDRSQRAVHARVLRGRAAARARRRRTRSSSSACRAPARRWSSRSSPAIPLVEGTMELPDLLGAGPRALRAHASLASRRAIPEALAELEPEAVARARRAVPRADPDPAQDGRAVLHRQDAEQLGARRPDPPDPAERQDHRCAPPSAELLLLGLQAALRPRPGLHLLPRGHRPLLPRLRRS